jgi:UDP-N-acetylglucosamine 2-epimerase (non-hydrolysing)
LASGIPLAASKINQLGLHRRDYIVVTIHRPEKTDSDKELFGLLESLADLSKTCPVFSLHPRARARIDEYGLSSHISLLTVLESLGYDEFVVPCGAAALVISDSGGIQEEATVWKWTGDRHPTFHCATRGAGCFCPSP